MARINLLPWREEKRKLREKNFYISLIIAVGIAASIVFGVKLQIDAMISYQKSRNNYLNDEIKKVDKAIAEIKDLQKKKKALIERMGVIQKFQLTRSDSVRLLDEIVKTTPEGVHLTSYEQKNKLQTFKGVAQSNARVSALMRNIDRSAWIESPNLSVILSERSSGDSDSKYSSFTMTAKQVVSEAETEGKDK